MRSARLLPPLFALWALASGCRTDDGAGAALTPPPDGGFGEVPRPMVVTDFDAPPGSLGDTPVTHVGVIPAAGNGTRDARPRWDTPGADAGADADAAPPMCRLLVQDCGPNRGCYIGPDGWPICQLAGTFGESSMCDEQAQCAPGLLCVEVNGGGFGTCQRACDPADVSACPGGIDTCHRLAWVAFGYCSP